MVCSAPRSETRLSEARSSRLIEWAKYRVMLTSPKAIQRTMMKVEALSPVRALKREVGEGDGRKKLEIPSCKLQRSPKLQAPIRGHRSVSVWNLGFGIS